MGAGKSLQAWTQRGRFTYAGSLADGTRIVYGRGKELVVPPAVYADLLQSFGGRVVPIGASRRPPRDSLGSWLRSRVHGVDVPVAYVGPILVKEGAAERVGAQELLVRSSGPVLRS